MLSAFYVVCVFFEVVPVDVRNAGFELFIVFLRAFFVWRLAIRSSVIGKIGNTGDFIKVIPCPRSDAWPVFFCHRNSDGRLVFAPVSLVGEPQFKMGNRCDIVSCDSCGCFLRKAKHHCLIRFINARFIWDSLLN